MVVSLIVLLVLFCVEEVPSHQAQMFAGRALMVRSINSLFEADAAVELKVDDFNTMLWAMPASSAIVEFFAHWWVDLPVNSLCFGYFYRLQHANLVKDPHAFPQFLI